MTLTLSDTITDEELLRLLSDARTFERGFGMLVAQYQEPLYAQIRRMVHAHADADDVLQNTFVKVYRSIGKFKGDSKLFTWLYRIATNESLTYLSKQKRRRSVPLEGDELQLANRLAADSYFSGDEVQRKLQLALDTLPDKQRAVFNARYFDALPYSEISKVMSTSVGALKASYHHAVKKIETYFTQHPD